MIDFSEFTRLLLLGTLALLFIAGLNSPATAASTLVKTVRVLQQPATDTTPGKVKAILQFKEGKLQGDTFLHQTHQWGVPVHDYHFKPGKQFIANAKIGPDGKLKRLTLGQNRKELKLLGLFAVLTLALFIIGRWEGLVGLFSALLTVLLFYFLLFPNISSPALILPLAGLICLLTIIFTIFLVTRCARPAWPVSAALLVVTVIVTSFTVWGLDYLHLNSTQARNSRLILTWINSVPGITAGDLWQLVTVGIVLSCLGAMMDVAIVIGSTIDEIYRDKENVNFKHAFKNGLNVGRQILTTMINTLVFAYLGLLLPTLLAVEVFNLPWLYFLNYDYLGIEILRLATGLLALSLSIPVTAAFSAGWCKYFE